MGSTRVIIPDRPGASEYVARIEGIVKRLGHCAVVRPVGDDWVVMIEGDASNDALADLFTCYVALHAVGDDAEVDRIPA